MKFNSKAHMAQELIAGKRFKSTNGIVVYYNENLQSPFRCGLNAMDSVWGMYNEDFWEEVNPRHVHQDLIDSYQAGQAWQLSVPHMNGVYTDCKTNGEWVKPDWYAHSTYRLHPHNELIQAHRNGAKVQAYICGDWVEEPYPDWYEDTQYRIKPATKTVYEWMYKTLSESTWIIVPTLMTEDKAKNHFDFLEHQKTGRSWEVEA